MLQAAQEVSSSSIAIIGMAGRFPGARNIAELWRNLRDGIESTSFLGDDELRAAGVPEAVLKDRSYVKAASALADIDQFDAEFFKYSPREAEFIDPQHRIFLECAVEAFCDAAIDPSRFAGSIGVFAGAALSSYLLSILAALEGGSNEERGNISRTLAVQGNDKDYLATRTSYKLDLRGPSLTVQTACSTSLVAVHLACQSLLAQECDLALGGGVSIAGRLRKTGYHHVEAGILSSDGHCRPFDARADGTIFGDGIGIVVLKRLSDAIADRDHIHAIIRGSAVNNDGFMKVGYTAPSVDGQASVIAEALAVGDVSAEEIGLIEAHGTATSLGDPVEIEALHQIFRSTDGRKQDCAIGSIKSNFGHLNTAAGVAGLIKAVLCVKHGEIPPSLNFQTPNPNIDLDRSPFYVPRHLTSWSDSRGPRRAGISSFGIGGTNAHVVIEQAEDRESVPTHKSMHVAIASAKSLSALTEGCSMLAANVLAEGDDKLADLCYTLAVAQPAYPHFRIAYGRDSKEIAQALTAPDAQQAVSGKQAESGVPVSFMFPGQGTQHIHMGQALYGEEEVFRRELDRCSDLLQEHMGHDLRMLLFPDPEREAEAEKALRNTQYAQPAIFAVSYALAKLWMSLGIKPGNAIGHSIGEFVAACLAGVMSLEDALRVVAARGRLMQELPSGAMFAALAPVSQITPRLPASLSIAAINGPEACVVSGPGDAIAAFKGELADADIATVNLVTSHAFHSQMMVPAVNAFVEIMRSVELRPPQMPFISNVTGDWIRSEEATDPNYWGRHLVAPVQFHPGLLTLLSRKPAILLETGPGRTLSTLARPIAADSSNVDIYSSLSPSGARGSADMISFLGTAAKLWGHGVPIDWACRYADERRAKLSLPPYAFQRRHYWIAGPAMAGRRPQAAAAAPEPPRSLLYSTSWKRLDRLMARDQGEPDTQSRWLIVSSGHPVDLAFIERRRKAAAMVTAAEKAAGEDFRQLTEDRFIIDPNREADFGRLFSAMEPQLAESGKLQVVYFCDASQAPSSQSYAAEVADKLSAIIFLLRQLDLRRAGKEVLLTVVTRDGHDIIGDETAGPTAAFALGPTLAAPHEYPGIRTSVIDLPASTTDVARLAEALERDLASSSAQRPVATAYRGNYRWTLSWEPSNDAASKDRQLALRREGIYLITGGLGGLGLAIARHLAVTSQARLILVSRRGLPDREAWDTLIAGASANDEKAHLLRELQRIEGLGAEIMVGEADVSDVDALARVVEQARKRFGRIDGVIHAAGLPGSTPIGIKTGEELETVLRPKVLGLAALEQVFADAPLDFLALFSSISAIEGRAGQVDYIAANAYLDAYARRGSSRLKCPIVSINWDTWREVGMAVRPPAGRGRSAESWQPPRQGLSTEEGVKAFTQALRHGGPQIIVTRRDLNAPKAEPVSSPANGASSPQQPVVKQPEYYARPPLSEPYVACETELEVAIADIWSKLLKTAPIGLNDNFFELGGHSLLALQLLPRIRDKYQIMFEPKEFFAAPTIAGVVEKIEDKLLAEIEEEEERAAVQGVG